MDKFNLLNARKIIHQARLNTPDFCISMAELAVVAEAECLTEGEKFLWMHLAAKTSFDSTLTCPLEPKELAYLTNFLPKGVFYAVGKLQKHHFLNIHHEEEFGTFYELSLPEAGLNTLADTPKVNKCRCGEDSFYSGKKNPK